VVDEEILMNMSVEKYTLRYPVSIIEGYEISDGIGFEIDNVSISLKFEDYYHVFYVDGFNSAEEACAFSERLWMTLALATTVKHTAFTVMDGYPQIEKIWPDPDETGDRLGLHRPVDVIVDSVCPSVYPSNSRLARVTAHPISSRVSSPFESFVSTLSGYYASSVKSALSDKLKLALQLYMNHYYEKSDASKLVTLMTTLEVLADAGNKHPVVLNLIEKWENEVDELIMEESEMEVLASLEAIKREMLHRKEDSKRGRIRALARRHARAIKADDKDNFVKRVVELYDLRSAIVHNGQINRTVLQSACPEAREVVGKILGAECGGVSDTL
jgi:hypothetical protein